MLIMQRNAFDIIFNGRVEVTFLVTETNSEIKLRDMAKRR